MTCARIAALLAAALCSTLASAQSWPSRPIRLLVPFVAGGSSDIVAREVGLRMQESLGQPVVVDNRPGANGAIAAGLLSKSNPDGYVFLVGSIGVFAINVALFRDLPYDPLRDFDLLSLAVRTPNVLIASPKLPASTIGELVAYMTRHPGKVTFASSGTGSSDHLSAEMFWQRSKTTGIHIPYKGGAAAMAEMVGGQVDASFQNLGAASQHIKAGRLRAFAVTGTQRAPQLPDVPTMVELGYPGFEVYSWQAFAAPRGLPKEVRSRLETAIVTALKTPQARANMDQIGFEVVASSGEQFREFLVKEIARWRQVVQAGNIRADP